MNNLNNANYRIAGSRPKEIDIKELFLVIKKRIWLVTVITILFTVFAGVYSVFFTTSLYQSSSRIIINADPEYRKTLQVIIKDSTIMERVSKELNLEKTPETLASQITVQSIDASQVVSISAIDTNPEMAANIANTTAKVFKDEVGKIVNFNGVQLLSDAQINHQPINDNQPRNILIGFIIGLVAGIGLVLFLDSLDDSVNSEEEVEEFLGVPVLGKVSKMKKSNLKISKHQNRELEFRGETIGH